MYFKANTDNLSFKNTSTNTFHTKVVMLKCEMERERVRDKGV